MAAWDAGDSKRLWHHLTKPLSVKYVDAEQQLDMQVTYMADSSYEVR
jgi:hypothetical protein